MAHSFVLSFVFSFLVLSRLFRFVLHGLVDRVTVFRLLLPPLLLILGLSGRQMGDALLIGILIADLLHERSG